MSFEFLVGCGQQSEEEEEEEEEEHAKHEDSKPNSKPEQLGNAISFIMMCGEEDMVESEGLEPEDVSVHEDGYEDSGSDGDSRVGKCHASVSREPGESQLPQYSRSISVASNNPQGRHSALSQMTKLNDEGLEQALLYKCDQKGMCPGLAVDAALNDGLDNVERKNDIRSLRLQFTGRRGVPLPQAILDHLWENTPD